MQELLELRKALDEIDDAIIGLVAKRFEVTEKVGILKKENNLPSTDSNREKEQAQRIRSLALFHNLDPEIAQKVLRLLIDETVKNHNKIKAR
ncbi:MAG: chorismate mutase [Spirochaetales bacterium]|nr:chorismate mutase [Spirochaetales bacterium]